MPPDGFGRPSAPTILARKRAGMGVFTRLQGRIGCRILVLLRASAREVAPLLPPGSAPVEVAGHALAAVCFTHFDRSPTRWLPHPIGRGTDHLRCSWLGTRAGAPERHFLALARHTSARRGVRLAERLLRAGYRSADFEFERSDTRARLRVREGERELLRLSVELGGAHAGSVFASPRAAREYLGAVRGALPADPLAPALDELGLSGASVGLEALCVREFGCGAFASASGGPALELDSAFELVPRRRATVLDAPPLPDALGTPAAVPAP
jgi:hypothetical protein